VTTSIRKLERVTLTALLGLRFQDVVTGEFVGAGLNVMAYRPGGLAGYPERRFQLAANYSGVYALHHAAGLLDFERREADDVWRPPSPGKPHVIEVIDMERRFLPFLLNVELPARGLYTWISPAPGSPVSSEAGVPLYSTAARQVPTGMAVARGELEDIVQNKPASWAALEIHYNGRLLGRGIADEMGRVAVIFPYPAPRASPFTSPIGSPPASSGKPLFSQEWTVELRAYYSPSQISPPQPVKTELRDLRAILGQQQANMWDDLAMTTPFAEATLQYGRELILRSREGALASPASPPTQPSKLFITPA
jgi:hypothetical protein